MLPSFAARHTMDSPEWYTPSPYVEAARTVMGSIDLDPASHEEANLTVKAARFFTEADNGLILPWAGRVFLNPPGGVQLVNGFWTRLCAEWAAQRVTQAIWIGYSLEQLQTLQNSKAPFHPLGFSMCIPKQRIAFNENEAKRIARLVKVDAENRARQLRGEKLKRRSERAGRAVARELHHLHWALSDGVSRRLSTLRTGALMKKKAAPRQPAIDRLRTHAPDGPPFLGILLDENSMRCLAAGVVNSRCEVAARKVLADFDAYTLQIEK